IWLRVELPEYGCGSRGCVALPREQIPDADKTFTVAVWDLVGVLDRCQREWEKHGNGGLTLELSVHSPSDSRHYCKELRVREADTAWSVIPRSERYRAFQQSNDGHGWENRRLSRPWHAGELQRVSCDFGGPAFDPYGLIEIPSGRPVPEVTLVTSLVIRRQFYHLFSERNLSAIKAFLPNLAEFRYEPPVEEFLLPNNAEWVKAMVVGSNGLKSLSVFQDRHR
ncbi:hypothetical protein C8A03DRAFT_13793, partial [Achaetomium macrosporum]